jgi:hypothetical protein
MKNQLFSKLYKLREQETFLKDKIESIKSDLIPVTDQLNKLQEEMSVVTEAILADMKKENIKTYTYEGKNVTSATRKSLSIVDEKATMLSLIENKDLRKVTQLSKKEIQDRLTIIKLNTTAAKEFAQHIVDIGGEVEGVEFKETNYLTVKEI